MIVKTTTKLYIDFVNSFKIAFPHLPVFPTREDWESHVKEIELGRETKIILNEENKPRVEWLLESLKEEKGKLLDIGCSTGYITEKIGKLGLEVIAVDKNPESIVGAVSRTEVTNSNVKYTVGDIESLEFEEDTFDIVVAGEILEHLFNMVDGLRELQRVAKPHSSIFITLPRKDVGEKTHRVLLYDLNAINIFLIPYFYDLQIKELDRWFCIKCKNREKPILTYQKDGMNLLKVLP